MNAKLIKAGTKLKEHKGTISSILGGGGVTLASIYMMLQQMIAPLPTAKEMVQMELRITKSFDARVHDVEKNLNASSIEYLKAMAEIDVKLQAHEKNFDFLRGRVESHHRRGKSAHSPD